MQSCVMIQTVELVELPGEDLILTESTLVHGKDLAMDSTLLPTLWSHTTTQLVANRFGATVRDMNTRYNAVLVCDIAPGRKYGIQYIPYPTPPSDYHSFHGKCKGIMGIGELNYDELVVFDYEAISPRYIIFCWAIYFAEYVQQIISTV